MRKEENDRLKILGDGLRRGLATSTKEPLPDDIVELLRKLAQMEKPRKGAHRCRSNDR